MFDVEEYYFGTQANLAVLQLFALTHNIAVYETSHPAFYRIGFLYKNFFIESPDVYDQHYGNSYFMIFVGSDAGNPKTKFLGVRALVNWTLNMKKKGYKLVIKKNRMRVVINDA